MLFLYRHKSGGLFLCCEERTVQIETMVEQGKAQFMVDVSRRKPELCYRVIPEGEKRVPEEKDRIEQRIIFKRKFI
jgi:hypothetical protein